VRESPLAKVLRLAGGTTRSYVRGTPQGKPVQVHQYPTPHPAGPKVIAPPRSAASQATPLQHGQSTFGALKKGQRIILAKQDYVVVQANVPASGPGSGFTTGSGVHTRSGVNTGSQGQGINAAPNNPQAQAAVALFGTPQQNPSLAALGNKPIPPGTATITNLLASEANHWTWYVTLPANFAVTVL
jgi:hypothetical protein